VIKRVPRADGFRWQVYSRRAGKHIYVGSFDSEREAKQQERRYVVTQEQIAAGELPPETDLKRTLHEAATDWLASLEKRGARSHEGYTDRMNLYVLPKLGDVAIARLTTPTIMEWRDEQTIRLAPATINGNLTCLSSACSYFVKRGWLDKNPCHNVERIERPEGVYRWIQTREEITRLLMSCPGDLRDIIATLLGTGMRIDEALHLQWADVDIERRLIAVHRGRKGTVKSGKARRIPILDNVLAMLRQRALRRGGAILVFPGARDKVTKKERVRSIPGVRDPYKLAVKRAGLDTKLRLHDTRHTFASHFVMDGGDIFALSKLLGHHSVTVTEKFYAHLRPDRWERDYGRVAFVMPAEAPVYEFTRGADGRITDRVLASVG
jgi:integrase